MLPHKMVINLKKMLHLNIDEMHNLEVTRKNKLFSSFHLNACSLSKNFDDLQHLLSCTKIFFDIIAVSKTITKNVSLLNNLNLNNYSFEFTPTETCAGGTLLYIANYLSYKCCNDLNIYKKNELEPTLKLKLSTQKSQILLWESFTDIHPWTLLTLTAIT